MREWLAANSVWLLAVFGLLLAVLLFAGGQLRDRIIRAVPEEGRKAARRKVSVALSSVEAVALGIIALTLAATLSYGAGVKSLMSVEAIQRWLLAHGSRILAILVAGMALWYALKKFVPPLVRRALVKTTGESKEGIKKRTDTLVFVFMGAGKIAIILFVIVTIMSELDIPVGAMLAGFGLAGVAIGFGAQFLIRDLIAGIFIILENEYRVGDVAKVADVAGLVEEITLRKTVLRDLDGIVHHVPNGEIKVASNYARHFARVNLNISVSYSTDLDQAISVINRVGQELAADEKWHKVIRSVPQVLRVDNLGDSGIEIKVLGDVKPLEQWSVMGELRLRIKKAFDAAGIEIPWPHVKVYFGDGQAGVTCDACSRFNLPGSQFCSGCGARLTAR
ncbi:MAG: mechanosensitive ion channel family protein [Chloroflexi bacterium]|nr:mechanosensitive ion channel family protein [Chloroflexota bacterium]